MKNKIMKAGGITLDPEYAGRPDDAHFFFEGNAIIREVLSNGASGIVYISELNEDIESPYVSFDHRMEFQKVNSIVAKFVPLHNNKDKSKLYLINGIEMRSTSDDEFNKEINIQTKIIEKTQAYLDPIGPSILYKNKITADKLTLLNNAEIQLITYDVQGLAVYRPVSKKDITCGIIFMELLSDMETLYTVLRENMRLPDNTMNPEIIITCINTAPKKKKALAHYVFLLIQLSSNGFIHCDPHTNNVLLSHTGEAKLLDFGRSEEITENKKKEVNRLISDFRHDNAVENLKKLVDYIQSLNMPVFKDAIMRDPLSDETIMQHEYNNSIKFTDLEKTKWRDSYRQDSWDEFVAVVEKFYGWFTNDAILSLIFMDVADLFRDNESKQSATLSKCQTVLGLNPYIIPPENLYEVVVVKLPSSIDFINMVLGYTLGIPHPGLETSKKQKQESVRLAQESVRLAQEAEDARLARVAQVEQEAREEQKARALKHIEIIKDFEPPSGEWEPDTLSRAKLTYEMYRTNFDQLLDELIRLLNITDDSQDQEEINVITEAIIYLEEQQTKNQNQKRRIGGAVSQGQQQWVREITPSSEKKQNNIDTKKEIQSKLNELLKIKEKMAETFAEWRDAIYEIYTEPDAEKREEYYSNLTPFAILIHVMVCCGLFGPLSSGQYINVDESHPQYNQLNSIAAAFSTMNNGYISMAKLQLETLLVGSNVDSKVDSKVEPTVAVEEVNTKLISPAINNELFGSELVEEVGGRKTRRKRKTRRQRKTRRKRFGRRKTNKRITRKTYKGFSSKYKYKK